MKACRVCRVDIRLEFHICEFDIGTFVGFDLLILLKKAYIF